METKDIPPKNESCIGEIPELTEGDTVVVETRPQSDSTRRKLTVEEVNPPSERQRDIDAIVWQDDVKQVLLSGYGTQYALTQTYSPTLAWKRVDLVWDSHPEGIEVSSIRVMNV